MVLANINSNLLLKQIADYAQVLVPGGDLLMSGFYVEDLGIIQYACEAEGFRFICNLEVNNWLATHFIL